ncbi:MAG: MBL fold metallo-hydrolase [Calditrichaeota bacterium]|nr:MAG: MBL fold metallo-hydrolase [Calditrichota bacterium]
MAPIRIKFWGVRGSIPTPGPRTVGFGGNTSCLEVQFPGQPLFILDAGSGIRELGKVLLGRDEPIHACIFISHFHWDHIQGLPFFKPAFKPGNRFDVFGCNEPNMKLHEIISWQMNPTYFPVAIEDMRAEVAFHAIGQQSFRVGEVQVCTHFLNHPGYTLGYKFVFNGKSLIYMCDNEPFLQYTHGHTGDKPTIDSVEELFESFVDNKEEALLHFIDQADLLIHDAQYFPEEYKQRITWGHSPYTYAVELAVKARVKQLILFHHDPDHDDATVERKVYESRQLLKEHGYEIPCSAAREQEIVEL